MFQGNIRSSDVVLKHVSCMVMQLLLFHGTRIIFLHFSCRMELESSVTVAFILWFSVNFLALRRRRAMQRLTRRRHLRFLRYKIFRFPQAHPQQSPIIAVIFLCGPIFQFWFFWALASSRINPPF